jgi:hypothetical protein
MRIRIVKTRTLEEADGIRLDQFRSVGEFRLGHSLGGLFPAQGWSEPVDDDANLFRERIPREYGGAPVLDRRRARRRR